METTYDTCDSPTRATASSLLVAVLVFAAACGDDGGGPSKPTPTATPTPIAAEALSGTYDSDRGIVIVSGHDRQLHFDFGLVREAFDSFGGTLMDDGTLEVSGIETRQDTGSVTVTGHLRVELSSTSSRIVGTVRTADGRTIDVDSVRPLTGTPSRFTGRYTILFAQSLSETDAPARAVIDVRIPIDGRGQSLAPADAIADDGTRVGTFAIGDCVASPMGKLQCRFPYRGRKGPGPFGGDPTFDAVLTGDIVTGPHGVQDALGTVIVANQPPITAHAFPFTTWSAALEPSP